MQVLEQQAHLFKSALFAGGINAHQDLWRGKNGGESIHGSKKPHYASAVAPVQGPPVGPFRHKNGAFRHEKGRLKPGGPEPKYPDLHQSFARFVLVVLHPVFVTHNLTIELVDQFIHRGIQILV